MIRAADFFSLGRCNVVSSLLLEVDDRRVKRLGCTHGIEVLAEKRDLPGSGAKEHHILLAVNAASRLDETFGPDFGDCGGRVSEGMHSHIENPELLHHPQEPRDVPGSDCFIPFDTWVSLKNTGNENINLAFVFSDPGFR
jgi:hypothetical protein